MFEYIIYLCYNFYQPGLFLLQDISRSILTYLLLWSKKTFTIVSNYLITIENEPCLIYINLFVLWTHKLGCEIIYFLLWAKLFITCIYTYRIYFFNVDVFVLHINLFIYVQLMCLQMHNHLFTLYLNFLDYFLLFIIYN